MKLDWVVSSREVLTRYYTIGISRDMHNRNCSAVCDSDNPSEEDTSFCMNIVQSVTLRGRAAAAPGLQFLGARNWWECEIFYVMYRTS